MDRARARRLAAWNNAERTLSGTTGGETIGSRLQRLTASASAASLSQPVDHYGDGIVAELEQRTADLLGKEDAAFFPTGTMAQQIALRCWTARTPTIASHPLHHLETDERDAHTTLSHLRTVHPTRAPRPPTPAEIRTLDEPFGTLFLELPLRRAGFVLPTWDDLTATTTAARERDAAVHFDGARLWECTPHFDHTLPEIAALADTVYVSYYKSLNGISGAALAGPTPLITEARAWRHRYGGKLHQQWPAALAALWGLDNELPRLPAYVAHAKTIAAALTQTLAAHVDVPWFHVTEPHTHQFQVWLPHPAEALMEAGVRVAEKTRTALFKNWKEPGIPPGLSFTEVTIGAPALEWTASDVDTAVARFLGGLREAGADGLG